MDSEHNKNTGQTKNKSIFGYVKNPIQSPVGDSQFSEVPSSEFSLVSLFLRTSSSFLSCVKIDRKKKKQGQVPTSCKAKCFIYHDHGVKALTFSLNFSFIAAMIAVRFPLLASIFWLSFSSAILLKLLFSSMAFCSTSFSCSRFSAKCFRTSASWFWTKKKIRQSYFSFPTQYPPCVF